VSYSSFNPAEMPAPKVQALLQGAVAPRPVAFAATTDAAGKVNLSPFSFFNLFSSNPPIVIFSPARRVRDNTTKHSLENVLEVPECTINMVSYEMVYQMSLASTEYDKGVNEFVKAGFTEQASEVVKPPRVAEAPVQLECKVLEVKALGTEGGAGNLIICEVLRIHVKDKVLDAEGRIDPFKIDQVARLGGDWYSRASAGLFEVEKPLTTKGIGVDALPESVRYSRVLTGNDLGRLGNVEKLPTAEAREKIMADAEVEEAYRRFSLHRESLEDHLHQLAHDWITANRVADALALLMSC
jgi:flavin reductase (DIM6/NTAB) family NADH-FMN oxidoreductase RutF